MKLNTKILLLQTIVIMTVMMGFSAIQVRSAQQESKQELKQIINRAVQRLQINLAPPLWNYDEESTKRVMELELSDLSIREIRLQTASDLYLGSVFEDGQQAIRVNPSEVALMDDSEAVSATIIVEETELGTVTVIPSYDLVKAKMDASLRSIIIQTIALLVLLLGASMAAIWFFAIRLISVLSVRIIDISEGNGDLTQELKVVGKDEISVLARGFNAFVSL